MSLNTQEINLILKIVDLALKHGTPLIKQLISENEKNGKFYITEKDLDNYFVAPISIDDFNNQ